MEVLSLFVLIAALLATVFLTAFSASRRSKAKRKLLPPGPWRLPVIGSLHHVLSTLPHRTLADLSRRHGPVMFLRLGELPTVVVSSAEAAALVMKTHDLEFADRANAVTFDIYTSGGISFGSAPYGERWRQLRKACVAALLTGKQVKRLEGMRALEVGKLLQSITASARRGDVINLTHKFSALSNNVSSRAMFSDQCSKQEAFLHAMDKVTALLGGFALVDLFPSSQLVRWLSNGEREMKKIMGHIKPIISEMVREAEAARAAARDGAGSCTDNNEDLLEALLRIQKEDTLPFPVTTEVIGAVLLELFAAGTETSATVLGWAMSELFNSPKIMAKVQAEVRQVLGPDRGVITDTDLSQLPFMQMVIKTHDLERRERTVTSWVMTYLKAPMSVSMSSPSLEIHGTGKVLKILSLRGLRTTTSITMGHALNSPHLWLGEGNARVYCSACQPSRFVWRIFCTTLTGCILVG